MDTLFVSRTTVLSGVLSAVVMVAACGDKVPPSSAFLSRVAGVYRERFPNSLSVAGGTSESVNILEVVPVDDTHAYTRLHLEFGNGAVGNIYGIAAYSGHDSLVYDNGLSGTSRCVLEIAWSGNIVSPEADYAQTPGCANYYGVGGHINGIKFKVRRRKDIDDMQSLRESREFTSAMDAWHAIQAR